jgi:hypothetical protein
LHHIEVNNFFSSSVHYDFGRHYGYARAPYAVVDPYQAPVVPLRVAPVAYGLGVRVCILSTFLKEALI